VVASADHLKKDSKLEKKVILVVTDGEDNESSETLEQAVRRLQADADRRVCIGILEKEEHPKHAKRALQIMSERTAASLSFPKRSTKWTPSAAPWRTTFAFSTPLDISDDAESPGGYRQVKVEARATATAS